MLSGHAFSARTLSVLACLLFLAVAGQFYAVTPILEGPDSVAHFRYVRYVANGHGLPVAQKELEKGNGPGAEGAQAPLYYLLAAGLISWIPTHDFDDVVVLNPSGSLGDASSDGNKNVVLHKPVAGFPGGTELAARVVELFSIATGLVTVVCAVITASLCLPRQRLTWLASGAAVVAVPAFAFHSTVVTNDILVTALSSLTVLFLVRWVKAPGEVWLWLSAVMLALALLTKFNAVFLLAAFGVAVWSVRPSVGQRLLDLSKALAAIAVIDGWSFVRSQIVNNDFTGMVAANRAVGGNDYQFERYDPARLGVAWHNMGASLHSFFAVFGATNIAAPEVFVLAPAVLGGIGLLAATWRVLRAPGWTEMRVVLTWALAAMAEIAVHNLIGPGNGRYLFPAIASLAVAVVGGWDWLLRSGHHSWLGWPLVVGSVGLSALAPTQVVRPAYAKPPILAALPPSAEATHVTFDGAVELIGYEVTTGPVHPGETCTLTLYWRSLIALPPLLNNFVHIESSNSSYTPGARYEGVVGHGSYPPSSWKPGEIVVDRYSLKLDPNAPTSAAPITLSVRVGMYKAPPNEPIEKISTEPAEVKDVGFEVASWSLIP